MEKLKFKHLNRVSGILLYFSILKNNVFYVKKKIFFFILQIQLQIWQKKPTYLVKLAATHFLNYDFPLSNLTHMK